MADPAARGPVQDFALNNRYVYTSKNEMVTALLRQMILSGQLQGSQALHQRDIAVQLGVSQTPVREALGRLEAEGLVVRDAHRGSVVAESAGGSTKENFQIRAALESLGAQLAANAITGRQLGHLEGLNEQMRQVGENHAAYAPLNREFHFAIYESADSPLLRSLMRLLWQSLGDGPMVARSHKESTRQHGELLAALRDHDGTAAAAITRQHIQGSEPIASKSSSRRPLGKSRDQDGRGRRA